MRLGLYVLLVSSLVLAWPVPSTSVPPDSSDVVFEVEPLNQFMRGRPEEWPDAAQPDWPGGHYAQPEQLAELTALMLGAGYGERAIRGILGENLMRGCGAGCR